jgi:hypothetical protein
MSRLTTTDAAKAIRKELRTAFPATTFRVRSHKYSMGCSINVTWTNGPTQKQVAELTSKYSNGHFDGMVDCYEYANDDRPGGADYVFCTREYSETARASAMETLAGYWADWSNIDGYQKDERLYRHLTATAMA